MMQNKHFQLKFAFLGPEKGMVYVIGAKFAMFFGLRGKRPIFGQIFGPAPRIGIFYLAQPPRAYLTKPPGSAQNPTPRLENF